MISRLLSRSFTRSVITARGCYSTLMDVSSAAQLDVKCLTVTESFITPSEQNSLMEEVELALERIKYSYDHWDDAIHGYRETEKITWSASNNDVIERLKSSTGQLDPLQHVHVLDLSREGYIKPHIDSIKFCGSVIVGVSLLSSSVMKLQHDSDHDRCITMLLPPLSLYIMRDVIRYEYTHEILAGPASYYRGQKINRNRRVSLICRTKP